MKFNSEVEGSSSARAAASLLRVTIPADVHIFYFALRFGEPQASR
jgi:hypothetical protein